MGVSVLAGGLAFVGSADATELILDGSFENTAASSNPVVKTGGKADPGVNGGWSTFSTYLYSTLYALPGPVGSGQAFLRPYPTGTYGITQSSDVVTQLVSLTMTTTLTPAKIDAGQGRYKMAAWFSGYRQQADNSEVTLDFLDAAGNVVETQLLGGPDFVAALPLGENAKYADAKDWGQDVREGTIPAGARQALVRIAATGEGAPDGYVELVSLDVSDAEAGSPIVATALPGNNAVNAGPVVELGLTLQDRITAVNTNSIQLYLDDARVTPSLVQKTETNTIVRYSAGLLPALSEHTYRIIFDDTGTPAARQTNTFRFTVADYLSLPAGLRTPLGSEDTSKPGFNVDVYQVDTLLVPDEPATAAQVNLPGSISFSEAVLAGLVAPNVADITNAARTNTFELPGTVNWVTASGAPANFQGDEPFPGIPGMTGSEFSFVDDIRTFIRFPSAGFYQMGINNEDQFRLTAAAGGTQRLQITAPTNFFLPSVVIGTNVTQLQFGGALPAAPLTGQIVYATPSGNPDEACDLAGNTTLAGKIVLLDRGSDLCNSATKAEQAQLAGAIAVLMITPGDEGFPFRIGDINANVRIPVLVIAEKFGGATLKTLLGGSTPVSATLRSDPNTVVAEWDGPKGFGAVDVTFGFAVPAPGLYPMRLVAGQEGGNANLEWFSIQPDGARILINDRTNPNALLAFRARTESQEARLNARKVSGGVEISWTGPGTLQEATALGGNWASAANQANPQTIAPTGTGAKFYRIAQ